MSVNNNTASQNLNEPVGNITPTSRFEIESLPVELQQAIVRFLPFGDRGELAKASRKMQAQVMTVSSDEEPRQISTFITNEIIPRLNGVIEDMALTPDERGENLLRLTRDIDKKVSDLCARTDTIDESVREELEENVMILKDINPPITEERAVKCFQSIKALIEAVQDLPLNEPDKQSLLNDLSKVHRAIFVCCSQAARIPGGSKGIITKIIGLLELLANHNHAVHSNGDFEELQSYIRGIKGLVGLAFYCSGKELIDYIFSDCKLIRAPYRDTFKKSFQFITKDEFYDQRILNDVISNILKMDQTELKKYTSRLCQLMLSVDLDAVQLREECELGIQFMKAAIELGEFKMAWDILQERYSDQNDMGVRYTGTPLLELHIAIRFAEICEEVLRSDKLSRQCIMSGSFMAFFIPLLSRIYELAPSDDKTLSVYAIVLRTLSKYCPQQRGAVLASMPNEIKQRLIDENDQKCVHEIFFGNIIESYRRLEIIDIEAGTCPKMFHFFTLLQRALLKDIDLVSLDEYVSECYSNMRIRVSQVLWAGILLLQNIDLQECSAEERHVYVTIWTKLMLIVSYRYQQEIEYFIDKVPKIVFEQMDKKDLMLIIKGLRDSGRETKAHEIADLYTIQYDRLIMESPLRTRARGRVMKRELMLPPNYRSALPQDAAAEAEERRYHPSELEPTDGQPKRRRRDDII